MPLLHCTECHHEWESSEDEEECDWCGGDSYMLDKNTPLSLLLSYLYGEEEE